MESRLFPSCKYVEESTLQLGSLKDVPGGIPESDLLGVTVALIQLRNKSVTSQLWQKMAHTPWHILKAATNKFIVSHGRAGRFSPDFQV